MRKSLLKRIAVVAMSLALAFSMQTPAMALGDVSVTAKAATENVGEYTISLTKKGAKKTLTLGIHKTLSLIVKDKNAVVTKNLKFASTKKDVATVSKKGLITTKKVGTTKINITDTKTKFKATLTIKVDYVDVSSLTLSAKSINLNVGQSTTLTAAVAPAYSAVPKWTSFFPEIATVNNGVVTAKAAGTGIIVVNAGTKMEFCRVNVAGATPTTVPVSSVAIKPMTIYARYTKGETDILKATVSPSNATNKGLDWDSTNPDIVDVDDNGRITINNVGTSLITATSKDNPNIYGTCMVTVTDLVLVEKTKLLNTDCYAEVTYDGTDTILSITGSEGMPNYEVAGSNVLTKRPWHDIASQITKVNIGPAVNHVGSYAFYECSALKQITLPKCTSQINDYAFYKCSALESVLVEKTGTQATNLEVNNNAFDSCSKLWLVCFAKTKQFVSLAKRAFENCTNIKSVLGEGNITNNDTEGTYLPSTKVHNNAY